MEPLEHQGLMVLGYYAMAVVSAVVPWVNAELLMLSAIPLAGSRWWLGALVLAVTAGQMTGKSVMYWGSRTAVLRPPDRWRGMLDRWQARIARHPSSAYAIVFVSAVVGLPPFYLISIAAGVLRVTFPAFFVLGVAGRLLHFSVVAFLPGLIFRAL